jgi:hypothetical protein
MTGALSNNPALAMALSVALAAMVSVALACLLHGARFPGGRASAAILAGIVAGVLLGPGVLGRVAPDLHRAVMQGGVPEQAEFDRRLTEARGAVAALRESGVTDVAIDEYEQRALRELAPMREAVDLARVQHRARWDAALAFAGAALLGLLPLVGVARTSGEIPFQARRAAFLAGAASFLLAGAILFVVVGRFTSAGWSLATLLFASACAVGWFAPPLDRLARERPTAVRESFVSGLCALTLSCAALLWSIDDRRAWFVAWAFIGALAIWAITKAVVPNRQFRRALHAFVACAIAPTVIALAAMRVDPFPLARDPAFWIALLAAIIACTDGRWFGALLGARALDPSKGLLTRRSVEIATAHTTSGVGLAQCALLGILAAGGPITETLLAAGLIGALLVETSAGLYRWAGAWFERLVDGS